MPEGHNCRSLAESALDRMTKPNPRRAAFDVWADYYDLTDTDRGPFVAFYRRLITERTRSLSSSAAGTGTIAIARTDDPARRDGLRVVGIDEWPWMLRLARERAKELDWVLGTCVHQRSRGHWT